MSITARPALALGLVLLLALSGCGGTYRPGVDGSLRTLPQNAPSNAEPQPAGSRPR